MELAKKHKGKIAFIATCQGLDREMKERIRAHQQHRPKHWQTFEEAKDLSTLLEKRGNKFECMIIDCLTLLVSNLILSGRKENAIIAETNKIIANLKRMNCRVIIVSNEVGLDFLPKHTRIRLVCSGGAF